MPADTSAVHWKLDHKDKYAWSTQCETPSLAPSDARLGSGSFLFLNHIYTFKMWVRRDTELRLYVLLHIDSTCLLTEYQQVAMHATCANMMQYTTDNNQVPEHVIPFVVKTLVDAV